MLTLLVIFCVQVSIVTNHSVRSSNAYTVLLLPTLPLTTCLLPPPDRA